MPAGKRPRMCLDKTLNRFYVKWGGKRRWLSKDRSEAQRRYAEELGAWARWVSEREIAKVEAAQDAPLRLATVRQLYEEFLEGRVADGVSDYTIAFYRNSLRRFLGVWSKFPPDSFGVQHLLAWKKDLLAAGYSPKTVSHELNGVRTLFQWGADLGFCAPRSLRGCRNPIVPERREAQGWTPAELRALVKKLPESVKTWAVTQYAGAMRTSEIVRLVHAEGDWLDTGIFKLEVSKTTRRWLVLSDWALSWLDRCEPKWTTLGSYRNAFGVSRRYDAALGRQLTKVLIPGGPRLLRHTAAQHLLHREDERANVELILGHVPRRTSTKYAPRVWQPLRQIAARLRTNLKGVA